MKNAIGLRAEHDLNVTKQIDQLCDEFEANVTDNTWPELSEFLDRIGVEHRQLLGVELVRIQLDVCRARGEDTSIENVLRQLPYDLHDGVRAAFHPLPRKETVHTPGSTYPVEGVIDDDAAPKLRNFRTKSRIASGGMGTVWLVRDRRVGRDVALKVMRAIAAHDPALQQRFINEAKLCGQLGHPYIVPVHALGRLSDGRPYYVMKLVEGETLAELIEHTRASHGDNVELLHIFHKLCEAIAFSHRKGVVHRDLKPQNIMVGRHGEVQLMDWGLAGILTADGSRSHETRPDRRIRRTSRMACHQTQFGDVFGTPSYMSPEQAQGLIGEVDEAADVFSLGAILLEILTGKPPYSGRDPEAIVMNAANANLERAFASLANCGADPLLVDIARKCLAPKKRDRFANGGDLAQSCAEYFTTIQRRLDEERLQLERERVASSERQRRRRLYRYFTLATSLLICVAGSLATRIWYAHYYRQQRSSEALSQIVQSVESSDLLDAQSQVTTASRAYPHDVRFTRLAADLQFTHQLDEVREKYYTWQDGWFDCFTALEQYERTFRDHGFESCGVDRPELNAALLATQIRNSAACDRIINAIDDWAWLAHREAQRAGDDLKRDAYVMVRNNLLAAARLADGNVGEKTSIRDPELWDQPQLLVAVSKSIKPEEASAEMLVLIGKLLPPEHRESFLTRCHLAHPDDFWVNIELGRLIMEEIAASIPQGDPFPPYPASKVFTAPEEVSESFRARAMSAAGYYRAAMARRWKTVGVRLDLAAALAIAGDLERAMLECQFAIENLASIPQSDKPLLSQVHFLYGLALCRAGDLDEAITQFQKAHEQDQSCGAIEWNLGMTLKRSGQTKQARAVLLHLLETSDDPNLRFLISEQIGTIPGKE